MQTYYKNEHGEGFHPAEISIEDALTVLIQSATQTAKQNANMTKIEELAILTEAVQKLGPDSYCGDWLKSILPEVIWLMRCDMIPVRTITQTIAQCDAIKKETTEKAAKIISEAESQAAKIKVEGDRKITGIRETLRRDIQKTLDIV
jgi:hypothetical protein